MTLRQEEVDWHWEKTKTGEKLTLTHMPTRKQVSQEVRFGRGGINYKEKKREVYEDLFDKLEEVVHGPQPKRGKGVAT